jgi:hypothetical protein
MIRPLAHRLALASFLTIMLGGLVLCGVAAGYFSARGTGTASAIVGSLNPPASVTAQQVAGDVTVDWQAPAGTLGVSVQGYRVTRSDAATVCGAVTPVTDLTCTDTDPPAGTYTYTVTAVYNSFTASASSAPIAVGQPSVALGPATPTVALGPATPNVVLASSGGVAGSTDTITGTGFAADSPVSATFGGARVGLTVTGTDASGGFSGAFAVPDQGSGSHTVVVTDGAGSEADAGYSIATPSLALGPTGGTVSAAVQIIGSGFPENGVISATYDGAALALSGPSATDAAGAVPAGVAFTVPGRVAGAHAVEVTVGAVSAAATFTVRPEITLTPGTGPVGSPVSVSGAGFAAGQTITATFDGQSVTLGPSTAAGADGTLHGATFDVPGEQAGSYQVVVQDASGDATEADFTVQASAIGLSPASGTVGSTASIIAQHFAPGSALTVTIGGSPATITSGATTDSAGASTIDFTIPALAGGPQDVVVHDASTDSAASAAAFAVDAQMTLSPAGGVAGTTDTITGAGFAAGSAIAVTWDGSAIPLSGATRTTAAGAIPSGVTLTVPSAAGGAHTLEVTTGGQSATSTFTVMPTFTVAAAAAQTAGAPFAVTITATAGGQTDTAYSGAKTLQFSGPGSSPNGGAPTYPAGVSFTAGVATAAVTLVDAQTTALTVTDPSVSGVTGTSPAIDVGAGGDTAIVLVTSDVDVSGDLASVSCDTWAAGCSARLPSTTSTGSENSWTFDVGLIDADGNPAQASANVTVGDGAPSLGDGTLQPATVPIAQGADQSTQSFTYTEGAGVYGPETFSVTSSGLTSASGSVTTF